MPNMPLGGYVWAQKNRRRDTTLWPIRISQYSEESFNELCPFRFGANRFTRDRIHLLPTLSKRRGELTFNALPIGAQKELISKEGPRQLWEQNSGEDATAYQRGTLRPWHYSVLNRNRCDGYHEAKLRAGM